MRNLLLLPLALTAGAAFAAETNDEDSKTIVVTAHSLKDTEAALKACIARKCPPDEDSRVTLAHAENQFISGSYGSARSTLKQSIGRNASAAKQFPEPVANLYRANARISAHLGEPEDYLASTLKTREALKAGFGADDWHVLASSIEVADMRARLGYPDEAERVYQGIIGKATEKGWTGLADMARLRLALAQISRPEADKKAAGRKGLEQFAAREGDKNRNIRLAAKILLARKASSKEESEAATKSVMAEYAASEGTQRPQLLFAPPIKSTQSANAEDGKGFQKDRNALNRLQTQTVENNWVDIGFWVGPDGKVNDIDILRSSQKGRDTAWSKPVIDSIKGRLYAPLKREPGDPGAFMVERYTLTADWESGVTGTRLRERSVKTHIERIDLTDDGNRAAQVKPKT